jgi:hypothetical protein
MLPTITKRMSDEVIMQYVRRLDPGVCMQEALTPYKDNQFALTDIFNKFSPKLMQEFQNHVGQDRLMNALLSKFNEQEGVNIFVALMSFAMKSNQFILIEKLLQKISKEVCNQLALRQDEAGWSILMRVVAMLPSPVYKIFVNHLTPETWSRAAMQNVNGGPGLLETIARYKMDKFNDFVEIMDAEACVNSAMMLNGEQSALVKIADYAGESALIKLLGKIYQHPAAVKKFTAANSYYDH